MVTEILEMTIKKYWKYHIISQYFDQDTTKISYV